MRRQRAPASHPSVSTRSQRRAIDLNIRVRSKLSWFELTYKHPDVFFCSVCALSPSLWQRWVFKWGTSLSPHTWAATVDLYHFSFALACVCAWRGHATLQRLGASLLLISWGSTQMLVPPAPSLSLARTHRCAARIIQDLQWTYSSTPGPCAHWA